MIKPPTPKPGRPRNEVRDPEGNPVPYLGSYERKNRKGNTTKTVYYSYWLDQNDQDKEGKPKRKKYYYKKPYPAVIIEHNQRMAELKGEKEYIKLELKPEEKQELALKFYREQQDYQYALTQLDVDGYKPNNELDLDKHIFLSNVRKFLSNPVKAAEELGAGWEQVRTLKDLPVYEDKVLLQELFDFYLGRKNPCGQESGVMSILVGLYKDSLGSWGWITDEAFTFQYWRSGEPNGRVNEDYACYTMFDYSYAGFSDLFNNEGARAFVVEYEMVDKMYLQADINHDHIVNLLDFQIMAEQWLEESE